MTDKEKIKRLRRALAHLVGSDDIGELQSMKDVMQSVPPALASADLVKATVNAIDTLIDIRE